MNYNIEGMDMLVIGSIAAIVIAVFMLTVIVTMFVLSHRIKGVCREINSIEKQVSDYIDELSQSENEKSDMEQQKHQELVISSVLQELFP